ncbi:septum formation protein Maf [Pandoraea thiooxydans]|uniref:dTTP/UTP pyrophosphatase n=1 Tax=Pandoraea thiooxydans TaxID=445709 RepID=A0A0G3EM22_9BURK|nr:Maf family protein [Pandoraea thiooxydans]AKJ67034.1 septum formation inhibitor Maf [Pandoraea thiooxydans]APR93958.1 septum formation protein Maf [Pandoraea thiooxydans]
MTVPSIYVASQSPRRQELLRQFGVSYELLLPANDENAESLETVLPGEPPDNYVQRVCLLKAQAAIARASRRQLPPAPILTADTTVCLDGTILGKPFDDADARAVLARLSGTRHRVLTAVAITTDARTFHALSISHVWFRPLRQDEIERYVASGEPMGKAGAYGIQGKAAEFIMRIDGSYSGIMGLPLYETAALLRQVGVDF